MKKLKSKHTGVIGELLITDKHYAVNYGDDASHTAIALYTSLDNLNEDWEDYEEPKEYWYIDTSEGSIVEHTYEHFELTDKERKETGNYFLSEEEAEKAVEKLKAWKRLKEAGYCFTPDTIEEGLKHLYILRLGCEKEKIMKSFSECRSNYKDLKILFGGEE